MFKKIIYAFAFAFTAALSGLSVHAQEAPDELVRRSTGEIAAVKV